MPQIIDKGEGVYLVRVFLGRGVDGRRQYLNKTIYGTFQEAFDFSNLAHTKESLPSLTGAWIYVIQMDDSHYRYIKIGKANSPKSRLRELQCGNAFPLKLLFQFRDAELMIHEEQLIHKKFGRFLVRGEWFLPDPSLLHWLHNRASGVWIPKTHLDYWQDESA